MSYGQWLELVKEEFYKDKQVAKRVKQDETAKEEFERYLKSCEAIDSIWRGYQDCVEEWEKNQERFTQKGATLESKARLAAHLTAHLLYMMFERQIIY